MTVLYLVLSICLALSIIFFDVIQHAYSNLGKNKLKSLSSNGKKKHQHLAKLADQLERIEDSFYIFTFVLRILMVILLYFFYLEVSNLPLLYTAITYGVYELFFGRLTTLIIARSVSLRFAVFTYPFVYVIITLTFSFKLPFTLWTKMMTRLFVPIRNEHAAEEEFLHQIEEAQQEGGINDNEKQLIKSIIDFDDLRIEDIITPRVQVIAIEQNSSNQKVLDAFKKSGYSRLPVYQHDIDHIVGILNHKDFYNKVLLGKEKLEHVIKPAVLVTEYMQISNLLELLKSNKAHMAVVKDEYNGTLGIVTMEDVLEEIVGDIWDEHDEILEQITQISNTSYQVKGYADLEEFFAIVGIQTELDHSTINGWVLDQLGRIPVFGDQFIYEHVKVTVMQADDKKVLEVVVQLLDRE